MYAYTYCVNNVHNSIVVDRERGGDSRNIFLVFSNFHIQKGVKVVIDLNLKIRIMSSVTMLKHNCILQKVFKLTYFNHF